MTKKKQKKKQKRSSKSQMGRLDHWGALDHSVPSIHRSFAEKAKKKQKKPKKVIKISDGAARPLGGPRPLGPFDPSIIRRKGKKKTKKTKKGHQNLRWGGSTTGGPSTTRSLRSIDHSQKRQKKNKKNQKRSSKSQVGGLDHWGALDHSVPSIHRSFAEKAKKKQKKPKKGKKNKGRE